MIYLSFCVCAEYAACVANSVETSSSRAVLAVMRLLAASRIGLHLSSIRLLSKKERKRNLFYPNLNHCAQPGSDLWIFLFSLVLTL